MPLYAEAILIDSSAAIALINYKDQFHDEAFRFFNSTENIVWVCFNITAHEAYTRARYDLGFSSAISLYDFLKSNNFYQLNLEPVDEIEARELLDKYADHDLSFHDALCAAVMKRAGIYKAFAFDHHFYYFGFELFPGLTSS
jgi:predicted nucleic acid-binding protein